MAGFGVRKTVPAIEVVDLLDGRFALMIRGLAHFVAYTPDECWERAASLRKIEVSTEDRDRALIADVYRGS